MARAAAAARRPGPTQLRIVQGRGTRKDGRPTDSGGRPINEGPDFVREAPEKPDHLSPDASWLWDRAVEQMMQVGLLKPLDGPALEVACENFARWRESVRYRQQHGLLGKNSQGTVAAPWTGLEERASREFRAWAAEFGFTPAAEKALAGEGGASNGNSGGDSGSNPF